MSKSILLLSVALLAATPSFASAGEPAPRKPETASATVALVDLDLSTRAGIAEAHKRLTLMSERLCGKFRNYRKADDGETYRDCVHDTMAGALERIQAPASSVARN